MARKSSTAVLEGFVQSTRRVCAYSMMARATGAGRGILGADGVSDPHQVEPVDDTVLTRALARLETLDFVGLTERFEESCAVFDARFRTGISQRIRREVVQRPEGAELSEYTSRVQPFLERDRVLYEKALERFIKAAV